MTLRVVAAENQNDVRTPGFQTTSISFGEYAYASSVTTGVSVKFSVGGGEGVSHSNPFAFHGFAMMQQDRIASTKRNKSSESNIQFPEWMRLRRT